MHQVALTQSIPVASSSALLMAGLGVAAGVSEIDVPFHCPPKMDGVLPVKADPSTSHSVVDTHDTELRPADETPGGIATVTCDHALPFQRSANATPGKTEPTARQKEGPTQETPSRVLLELSGPVTPVTTPQELPFHISISRAPPVACICSPTAVQNEALEHETADSPLTPVPAGAPASVHAVAPTVGALVRPAPAGAAPMRPTVKATSPAVVANSTARKVRTRLLGVNGPSGKER
jgi:hypothetical protein